MTKESNENKIILDLCGGTGSWSKPYKDAGYDVRVITLPDYDVTDAMLSYDFIGFFSQTKKTESLSIEINKVYGILAAPPCTMFSLARTTAKTPRDFKQGLSTVNACLEIIKTCRISGGLKFWALENPVGYLRQFLGKPPLTFNPCDYGDLHTKKTDLWGYYNEPKKSPVIIPDEIKQKLSVNNRELPELPEGYIPPDKNRQAARRAMTPQGFARAFYKANK